MPFDGGLMETRKTATTPNSLSLLVRMPDGGVLSPSALAGDRLIDALGRFGISLCSEPRFQAHVAAPYGRIKAPWMDRLPAPAPDEKAQLAAQGVQDGTIRLLSEIVLTPELDGLELELPWDSLVPQTYWVAG